MADTAKALKPVPPQVHPEAPGNLAFDWHYGDEAKVTAAFQRPPARSGSSSINNKVICNAMEPRACVAELRRGRRPADSARLHSGRLGPSRRPRPNFGMEADKVRVLTPDVGGGFGMKAFYYPEYSMAGSRRAS